jgi:hypothetical protein
MRATTTTTTTATTETRRANPAVVRLAEDFYDYPLLDLQRQTWYQAMPSATRRALGTTIRRVGNATIAEARAGGDFAE